MELDLNYSWEGLNTPSFIFLKIRKEGFEMDENKNMLELSKALSDISKNSAKAFFKIGYTETAGNVKIHKEFQEFCFEHTNNEYLQGLKLLLTYAKFTELMKEMNERITKLEARQIGSEPVSDNKSEVKTF